MAWSRRGGNAPGHIVWSARTAVAEGYLACDGALYLRTAYADLFAAIGTTFNIGGELATQFRVPNVKQRVLMGEDTGFAVGASGGAASASVAAHTHDVGTLAGSVVDHQHSGPSHSHSMSFLSFLFGAGTNQLFARDTSAELTAPAGTGLTGSGGAQAVPLTGSSASGGGGSIDTRQPYLVLRAEIKT